MDYRNKERVDTQPLKICLIASELLGWGVAGGYGFATRNIASGLAASGHKVSVVLPCPSGKAPGHFTMSGFEVIAYPRKKMFQSRRIFQAVNADIYHSQEPSIASYLAQRGMPHRVHIVTSRDPRDWTDWWIEMRHPNRNGLRTLLTTAVYENPMTYSAVRHADRVCVPALHLVKKVQRKYRLAAPPGFLPTPIGMPEHIQKSPTPLVCYVGRLDRRKRPERFLALAESFPDVQFKAVGHSQDASFQKALLERYGQLENLEFLGFINQFEDDRLHEVLEGSWVFVNTAAREGLPNSFIEAAGHGCAIISELDPDGFTSRFGRLAQEGDFAEALRCLLTDNTWQKRGEAGRDYARATNLPAKAIALHLEQYRLALRAKALRKDDTA